ncbi:MAG: T9SS type A sorting domain-containing protein [Ignavibacteriae bacterium]|nr:T9SS type A sorting domain-containing protein [Ignavibacteriota bacterium]
MKKILLVLLFFSICINEAESHDTNAVKYFPLTVGNVYLYSDYSCCPPHSSYIKSRVTQESIINNKKYYYCTNFPISTEGDFVNGWYRVDSLSGNLYRYDSNNSCIFIPYEKFIDSLSALNGDSIKSCGIYTSVFCFGTSNISLFGNTYTAKKFWQGLGSGSYSGYYQYFYIKDIGYYKRYSEYNHPPSNASATLIGCYVNGVLYGDTSTTDIRKLSSDIPLSFALAQNYPNPFNPTTKIKFDVVKSGNVKILVYDILGREVQTLVNEMLQPGKYETTFDGSNLTSGIYFYRLTALDNSSNVTFTETKRLVYLK